jgi:hypothetical protein
MLDDEARQALRRWTGHNLENWPMGDTYWNTTAEPWSTIRSRLLAGFPGEKTPDYKQAKDQLARVARTLERNRARRGIMHFELDGGEAVFSGSRRDLTRLKS